MRVLFTIGFLVLFPLAAGAGDPAKEEEGGAKAERDRLLTKADDHLAMMELYAEAQHWPKAIAKGREALQLYLALGEARQAGRVQTRIGALCLQGGLISDAKRELHGALTLQKSLNDHVGACLTLSLRARTALAGRKPEEAIPHLLEGFGLIEEHNLRGPFFLFTATSKDVRERLSVLTPAPVAYFDLVEKEAVHRREMGWANHNEALLYEKIQILQRDGRFEEAATACRELFAMNEKRKYRFGQAAACHNLGMILAANARQGEKRFEKADEAYRTAERIRKEIGDFG
ncbi:MAG: hypothetical protein ACYTHM_19970, partial [Planctomycetota bacterium]